MHTRKTIVGTGIKVLMLILCMLPVASWLSEGKTEYDKENIVAQALTVYRQHKRLPAGRTIEPMIEMEDAWAIEDTRKEAEEPLVTRMLHQGAELGFDRESRTFYCTLGMENTEDWPSLEIFAGGGTGSEQETLRVAWIDDYTYDYCADAIREGYRYEALAYTDTEYEYVGVVFTGLPIVTLHVYYDGELGEEYVPARVSVAGAGYEPIDSAALTHLRGGGYYKGIDKFSYRIEFHDESSYGDDKKASISVLGMEADTDWLLLSNAQEDTAVRNYLAYDMWDRWNDNEQTLMKMDSRMIELFVNDEYMGLYQLMERINYEEEIQIAGGEIQNAAVMRLVADANLDEKPWKNYMERARFYTECRYVSGDNVERAFELFDDYVKLSDIEEGKLSDQEFDELAKRRINIDEMLSYYLFLQSCGLVKDNAYNNLYIWIFQEGDQHIYKVSPWDMDTALPVTGIQENGAIIPYFDMTMVIPCRLLDLDVSGSRERIWTLWNEKRSTILSDDALYEWIMGVEEWINASGAYLRETDKWRGGARLLDLSEILYYETQHMNTIEWHLNEYWPLDERVN